jgi:coenzyme PQQ biosynthesis protein C
LTGIPYTDLADGEALEAALRQIGAERYHNNHRFHHLLHGGKLAKGQVQAWALNRYYYQSRIPMKDAALISRVSEPELRREWAQRVIDHDGTREGQGGVYKWLRLCTGLGLDEAYVRSESGILPATKFAVEAYIHFVRDRSLLEAVASSLTELFSPGIIRDRVAGMLQSYPFVDRETLGYFEARLTQAPRDSDFALAYVKAEADTPEKRRLVCEALIFKCDVLWAQLDALHHAYVLKGGIPPGAFRPEGDPEELAA